MQASQIWPAIRPHWQEMGQIWEFLRSVSVHFGSASQNVLKLILKSPRFVLFVANLAQFRAKTKIPDSGHYHTRGKTRISQALFPPLVFALADEGKYQGLFPRGNEYRKIRHFAARLHKMNYNLRRSGTEIRCHYGLQQTWNKQHEISGTPPLLRRRYTRSSLAPKIHLRSFTRSHGCQIWAESRSDWPKWDKSWTFFR